jgi:hypothetical protein
VPPEDESALPEVQAGNVDVEYLNVVVPKLKTENLPASVTSSFGCWLQGVLNWFLLRLSKESACLADEFITSNVPQGSHRFVEKKSPSICYTSRHQTQHIIALFIRF